MRIPLVILFLLSFVNIHSQDFPDTLITDKGMMIPCKVLRIEEHTVYYKPAVLDKKTKKGFVHKRNISSLALHSEVPVKGELPMRNPYIGKTFNWTEKNGIIYANLHDAAPQLGEGEVTMNLLLEKHVRATGRDRQLFGDYPVTMLLKLWIDEKGMLQNVKIDQYASVQGVEGTATRYIEREILNVVSQFQPWRPATMNGVAVPSMIYLPLKFRIGMNSIVMLPSKYVFSFNGRKQ